MPRRFRVPRKIVLLVDSRETGKPMRAISRVAKLGGDLKTTYHLIRAKRFASDQRIDAFLEALEAKNQLGHWRPVRVLAEGGALSPAVARAFEVQQRGRGDNAPAAQGEGRVTDDQAVPLRRRSRRDAASTPAR